jgi:hypothetical protein
MGCTLQNSNEKSSKNPHAGEIGERENNVCFLKRNKVKNSHVGKIGEGESDVRC